jgi:hypothetical protein
MLPSVRTMTTKARPDPFDPQDFLHTAAHTHLGEVGRRTPDVKAQSAIYVNVEFFHAMPQTAQVADRLRGLRDGTGALDPRLVQPYAAEDAAYHRFHRTAAPGDAMQDQQDRP